MECKNELNLWTLGPFDVCCSAVDNASYVYIYMHRKYTYITFEKWVNLIVHTSQSSRYCHLNTSTSYGKRNDAKLLHCEWIIKKKALIFHKFILVHIGNGEMSNTWSIQWKCVVMLA